MPKVGIVFRCRGLAVFLALSWLAVIGLRGSALAAGPETPASPVAAGNPAEIGVLLLPATDTEPWAASVLTQRQDVVRSRLEREFLGRGFKTYHESLALAAAGKAPKIDLADPVKRTAENLEALARRTGANWVVSVDVQEVAENPELSNGASFRCFCRVALKVWDTKQHAWRADGVFTGNDQGASGSPVWRFLNSIDDAARVAIASVLDRYPVVIDMGEPMQFGDYLRGQTQAFVPKVGEPFGGLKLTGPQ